MPLASFAGVAHHVRASLSGTRHELILVHPDREKSVLLSLAAKVAQAEVDRVAALLGHKEISPGVLYRFTGADSAHSLACMEKSGPCVNTCTPKNSSLSSDTL